MSNVTACPAVDATVPPWISWRDIGVRVLLLSAVIGLAISVFDRRVAGVPENLLYSESIGLSIFTLYGLMGFRGGASPRRSFRAYLLRSVVAIPVGFFIGINIASGLTGSPVGLGVFSHVAPFAAIVTGATSLAFVYYFWSRHRLAEAAKAEADARRTTAEARLKLLQAQIEPHMLFNTLANLRTLVDVDPLRAQAMIDQLIVYLRGTLAASRSTTTTLEAEFAQLEAYLTLMQVRMAHRLAFTLDLPDALRATSIPPMLLQPLVENAIKHGLEPRIAGGTIRVSASSTEVGTTIEVNDDGNGLDEGVSETGYGLEHVRERLRTLYGSAGSLSITARPDGGVRAVVEVPR